MAVSGHHRNHLLRRGPSRDELPGEEVGSQLPHLTGRPGIEGREHHPVGDVPGGDPIHDVADQPVAPVRIGFVDLDFDVHVGGVTESTPRLVEGGDEWEISPDLDEVELAERLETRLAVIVMEDQTPVAGGPDVDLHTIGALFDRQRNGFDGVVPGVRRGSSVAVDERASDRAVNRAGCVHRSNLRVTTRIGESVDTILDQ